MIVETKVFKESCSKILQAVTKSELAPLSDTLELKTQVVGETPYLLLSVTNREYYISIRFMMSHTEEFHATVNASTFLKLVAQITSETVELKCTEQFLSIKANGSYRLPLIFEGEQMLKLPTIEITNVLVDFDLDVAILKSILKYNSRRIAHNTYGQEIQKAYYIDQEGCITFSQGACVNTFSLAQPTKFLLSDTVVKLFKLFENTQAHFTLGIDPLGDTMQTKVAFSTDSITLAAVTPAADLDAVPVAVVRTAAQAMYPQSVVLNRGDFLQALNRLITLAGEQTWVYGIFTLTESGVQIQDLTKNNSENLKYQNGSQLSGDYTFVLALRELKQLLSDWSEEYVTLGCGSSHMIVIRRGLNIVDVLPEVAMDV